MEGFFQKIIDVLNSCEIPYMLSGSVAMSLYIVPRATQDFDFIVHLRPQDIDRFVENFKEGYYCDKDAIEDAVQNRSMFNIIDHATGFKADFVVLKSEPFRQNEFTRRIPMEFFGKTIYVVSPEDLIISKLIWIQELQSAVQMGDIKNLVISENLDWEYINLWIGKLNLNTFSLLNHE
ncbi:MAG TPA: DUF6036 family nucleotidyltransferase [Puia sp.]|nr:DUF6036 family nucleotidyltransferase [Puia sp.]